MKDHGKNVNDGKNDNPGSGAHNSPASHNSHPPAPPPSERLLPPRGDYHTLLSFQKAEVIYDITFRFAHKFLAKSDRTIDQMIQSARSGKKNILEGSKAGLTSKETEIKLTNVARASLEELLDDYGDYLRARDLRIWDKDSKEALYVRKLGRKTPQTYEDYREFVETRSPEVIANIAICLIHQTNYLIDQQVRHLEQEFLQQGGLRERMTRARMAYRNGKYGKQGNDDGKGGQRGGDSRDGSSGPGIQASPDSPSSQQRKPSDRRNPPRAPGGQP
jgi:four helix bundle suffix protein